MKTDISCFKYNNWQQMFKEDSEAMQNDYRESVCGTFLSFISFKLNYQCTVFAQFVQHFL